MKTIMAFIKRHPVLSYFALTFAISWGGMLLVIGGPGAIRGTEEQVEAVAVANRHQLSRQPPLRKRLA